jgi:hypothetical protein
LSAPTPNLSIPVVPFNSSPSATTGTPPPSGTTVIVNQTNNTNATADSIAASTAWAIRSSGDLNFAATRAMERSGSTTPIVTKGKSPLSGTSVRGD